MPLNLDGKKSIVAEAAEVANKAISVVAANYSGLTVAQVTSLRQSARSTGVHMRVIRNTLARRAFEGTKFACMDPVLVGPLVLAFSMEDPGAAARLLRDFSKKFEKLQVKALSIDGILLPAKDIDRLASDKLGISETDLGVIRSGTRTEFAYRMAWERTHAKAKGYISKNDSRMWAITDSGKLIK